MVCQQLAGCGGVKGEAGGSEAGRAARRRYGVRLVVVAGVALMITEQYLQPTIANSLHPLRQLNWPRMFERVLKLSLPTLYGWLLIFYALFHLWCAPAALP